MSDLISVITPCYQAQTHIANAVKSLLAQTHSNWEMLIINDDGIDYRAILDQQGLCDSRIRYFSSGGIQTGPNQSRNVGLRHAAGQWIAPLDADDVYYPSRLEVLLKLARSTGLSLDNVFIRDTESSEVPRLCFAGELFDQLTMQEFFVVDVPLLFLFRRDLIGHPWDVDIPRSADTLFNLRALEKAGHAQFEHNPLHEYRVHSASLCHRPAADQTFNLAYELILTRLKKDGLGFQSAQVKERVYDYFAEKLKKNRRFATAIEQGFDGNFQQFCQLGEPL